jgi:uncharacterized lipoprotein YmbA
MKYILLVATLLIAACAGKVPETTTYLLRADTGPAPGGGNGPARVGIGSLTVAPYINRSGLILETGTGEISSAQSHQWAEPLHISLRQYLGTGIAVGTGESVRWHPTLNIDWERRLDIQIDQLHGTAGGDAQLLAYWTISDAHSNKVLSRHRFADTEPLSRDGYAALVDAQRQVLDRLGAAIAESLEADSSTGTE